MELQDQVEIGRQAEEFLRYTQEHPYFEGLLDRIKLEMTKQILMLTPQQTYTFAEIKSEMNGIDQIMNAVRGDIYLASEALKQIDGVIDRGGIL
jgi:hypothetical protein